MMGDSLVSRKISRLIFCATQSFFGAMLTINLVFEAKDKTCPLSISYENQIYPTENIWILNNLKKTFFIWSGWSVARPREKRINNCLPLFTTSRSYWDGNLRAEEINAWFISQIHVMWLPDFIFVWGGVGYFYDAARFQTWYLLPIARAA